MKGSEDEIEVSSLRKMYRDGVLDDEMIEIELPKIQGDSDGSKNPFQQMLSGMGGKPMPGMPSITVSQVKGLEEAAGTIL